MLHFNKTTFSLLAFFTISLLKIYSQTIAQNNVEIIQNETTYFISKSSDSVELSKSTFAIRFYNKAYDSFNDRYYAAKIAFLELAADTNTLKIGQTVNNIPFFEAGTGMSTGYEGNYEAIIISNTGHHYIYYENKKNKRVELISKIDDLYKLEWEINQFYMNDTNFSIAEIPYNNLYMVIFIDSNLNDIIDSNELKTVHLKFH